MDAVGVLHLTAGEVLEPLVAVEAAAILPELGDPGPHFIYRRVDRDCMQDLRRAFRELPRLRATRAAARRALSPIAGAIGNAYPRFRDRTEPMKLREAVAILRSPDVAAALEMLVSVLRSQRE